MFNFRSLAEVVGVSLEGENAGRRLSQLQCEAGTNETTNSPSHEIVGSEGLGASQPGKAFAMEPTKEVPPNSLSEDTTPDGNTSDHLTEGRRVDEQNAAPATSDAPQLPELTITPNITASVGIDDDSKALTHATTVERAQQATQ
jgi:hypothetical protein